ncbi:hypothetical protein B9T12_09005 [Wohlfahrtiimonas chitiniclastica]|uniref:TniB family NTP-binding protein n=1 Tax=Wohlfahrtiimonas chitiniclastica TaxID=400946 RepID=UPI000B98B096|nr:TniB family NTP-binding protein [Wohlfahrtiimonas chitiniclastica]OYQ77101.1 hypothetical protein B9T12_09005 [Wohlfahrtiimonas chitiniclastica]
MPDLVYQVIVSLKNTTINHPQFHAAYIEIEKLLQLKQQYNIARHALCTGSSGTGKSTLKIEIEKAYPQNLNVNPPQIPILIIDTPAIPTVKNVAESMLVSLGDPLADKGSAINKTTRILNYLELCNVQLMIFDELQHFIDQGKKNTPYQVSDWLKSLIDAANIPTVLMGLERSEQLLKVNEQLRRRFNKRIYLFEFKLDAENDYLVFAGVLKKILSLLPIPHELNIQNQELLQRIHYATNGIIDYMIKLFIEAFEICHMNQQHLTTNTLHDAFLSTIWSECSAELNPFTASFAWKRLIKPGMPFHKQPM